MVTRYVILANSNDKTFDVPRQLIDINGEKLIERTIKLLKKNGIKDITIVASDPQFEKIGEKIDKISRLFIRDKIVIFDIFFS